MSRHITQWSWGDSNPRPLECDSTDRILAKSRGKTSENEIVGSLPSLLVSGVKRSRLIGPVFGQRATFLPHLAGFDKSIGGSLFGYAVLRENRRGTRRSGGFVNRRSAVSSLAVGSVFRRLCAWRDSEPDSHRQHVYI